MEVSMNKELSEEIKQAAIEAIRGLQLTPGAAVRFILKNVNGADEHQARKIVDRVYTGVYDDR
jgi:antitoxin component of RelBE/YafQ-DinJ toxin-antitoxin module